MSLLRSRTVLSVIAIACGISFAAGRSYAQTNSTTSGGPPPPLPDTQPLPPPPPPNLSLFPGVAAFGQTLADKGVYLQLGFNYNLNSLVVGGFKTGTVPNSELTFGTILDLQKLLGIPEASFHVTFDERSGYGLGNNVGTGGIENNVGPTRATRLGEFYWEQGFYNDRIDVKVGRTNPTLDFAVSDISCEFVIGAICAQPNTWYSSNNNEAFPASSWGGFVNFALTPQIYFRTGVYDDDPSQLLPNQQGLNWNVNGSTGVFVPMEVGYQTNFENARYPAKYDVGGYWDASSYTTPNGVPMQGRTAYYVQAQQTVWRPNPKTHQSLTAFAGGIAYTGGAPYWGQYYAGLYDRGPFASRPVDSIGFIGSYYANSSDQRPNKPGMWSFELNYGIQVCPGVNVKPYTQYFVAPTNFLPATGSSEPKNAWVVGVSVSLNLAQLFGFPVFTAY